jgi:hypothetical protein
MVTREVTQSLALLHQLVAVVGMTIPVLNLLSREARVAVPVIPSLQERGILQRQPHHKETLVGVVLPLMHVELGAVAARLRLEQMEQEALVAMVEREQPVQFLALL